MDDGNDTGGYMLFWVRIDSNTTVLASVACEREHADIR